MKEFRTASMDISTKIFTIIFSIIILGSVVMLITLKEEAIWFPVVILLVSIISSYMLIPKLFIDEKNIIIKNYFVKIKIPVEKIIEISKYEKIGFNFRTFGVGGLFGYFGYFNGNDVWYVTNIKKKIKISLAGKVYMISPENPEYFLEETEKLIHK